ncbi:hypothetical protein IW261DRAFT_652138 [Armillaria novae-zelandiae]|uniref:Uncharacterized protein n=1 Tax=Armillaria novae-zelandiae TaxID=153914 RepID=A0AA39PQE0_9AGAR|nr:hypothetical protein IW261DRAFT_652138 [Armillaria novae-zelandiae]
MAGLVLLGILVVGRALKDRHGSCCLVIYLKLQGVIAFVGPVTIFFLWLCSYDPHKFTPKTRRYRPHCSSLIHVKGGIILPFVHRPSITSRSNRFDGKPELVIWQCWKSRAHEQSRVGSLETAQDERTEGAATQVHSGLDTKRDAVNSGSSRLWTRTIEFCFLHSLFI